MASQTHGGEVVHNNAYQWKTHIFVTHALNPAIYKLFIAKATHSTNTHIVENANRQD
jgi:hypothetical protein